MGTSQFLARIGSVAAFVGAIVLFVFTLLHPLDSDPNDASAAFSEYAADTLWVWSHLGQFVGTAVLGLALVALAGTFEPGRAAALARLGVAGAAATIAMAAALQAVDGVALKIMVDRWAAAPDEAREATFEAAFAVRQVEVGLASLLSITFGLTTAIYGAAMVLSARYPAWLGGVGLLGGVASVMAGAALASAGFSGLAMTISMGSSFALLAWIVLTGTVMWRLAPQLPDEVSGGSGGVGTAAPVDRLHPHRPVH